jgi:anti-sigma regulatory factor (Ser/Thr protein kinase)
LVRQPSPDPRKELLMGRNLTMDGRECRTIRVKVDPTADFRRIIHTFDSIELPKLPIDSENLKFTILELVNNSIRAHKERGEAREIIIDLTLIGGRLNVTVRDFGGGFDPRLLPYPLDADPSGLDIRSPSFLEYQERNGYKRFGMGIYLAKKTFDNFRLIFLDARDIPVSWDTGRAVGTLIRVDVRTREDDDGK